MSNKAEIKLIDGTYVPEDAAEVLFSVLSDKIRFHNIQILSIKERNSGDTAHSESRLKELQAAKDKLSELLKEAKQQGKKLELKSTIEINFI